LNPKTLLKFKKLFLQAFLFSPSFQPKSLESPFHFFLYSHRSWASFSAHPIPGQATPPHGFLLPRFTQAALSPARPRRCAIRHHCSSSHTWMKPKLRAILWPSFPPLSRCHPTSSSPFKLQNRQIKTSPRRSSPYRRLASPGPYKKHYAPHYPPPHHIPAIHLAFPCSK
jgi:hypothetical protein